MTTAVMMRPKCEPPECRTGDPQALSTVSQRRSPNGRERPWILDGFRRVGARLYGAEITNSPARHFQIA
jgi:hypothetical protein